MSGYSQEQGALRTIGKALAVSVAMAAIMMLMAYGFMYLFSDRASLPFSMAIVLGIFAISFIVGAVLLERSGIGQVKAIAGGAAAAVVLTVAIVTAILGVINIVSIGYPELYYQIDSILAGFAISLIAALVIDRLTLKI